MRSSRKAGSRASLAWIPVLLCGVLVADAAAAPTGNVELHDGRKWENVTWETRGGKMYVTFPNNRGGIVLDLDEVKAYREVAAPVAEPDEADPAAEAAPEGAPASVDWEGRFCLEPPEGWEVAAPTSPLMRAQLRHEQKDATLAVYIRPVPSGWDPRSLTKPQQDEVVADLNDRYAKAASPRIVPDTLFDAPVARVDGASVTEYGSTVAKKMTELRFRRFGLEYSLTYVVGGPPADATALAPSLPRLFEAFTFLPTVTHTEGAYGDYGRGFWIERANADWRLQGAPFDPEQPVRIHTPDDRGELLVQVHPGTDAEAVLRGIIDRRKSTSRTLTNQRIEAGEQGGTPVKRFQFEDYRDPGGRKKLLYKGFAALLLGKVVVFTGVHPMADDDARKLQGELETMLAGVRLWDADRIRQRLNRAQNAMALVSQGVNAAASRRHQEALQKFDEALRDMPEFARALYLRAQTKKELGDFNGQREDLEKAAALDPSAGYDAALVQSYAAEAAAAKQQKDWGEALRLYLKVYRSDKSAVIERELTAVGSQMVTEYKKELRSLERNMNALEREFKPFADQPAIAQWLGKSFIEVANHFQREKKFREAKKMAEKARRVALDQRGRDEAARLITQIEAAAEAFKQQR